MGGVFVMAAARTACTIEQQTVIRFLWPVNVETSQIYGRTEQYADNCITRGEV